MKKTRLEMLAEINRETEIELQINKFNRTSRTNIMETLLNDWETVGINIKKLTPFHYRLSKGNYIVDYFPTSGKYHDIKQKLWDVIEPNELINLFPDVVNWDEIDKF